MSRRMKLSCESTGCLLLLIFNYLDIGFGDSFLQQPVLYLITHITLYRDLLDAGGRFGN